MQTISREEYEKKYGASSAMKLEQAEISRSNRSTIPSTTPKDPMANRFTEAIGLGGATDVFGRLMSRSFVGNMMQTQGQRDAAELNAQVTGQPVMSQQDINRGQIEAPTGKEVAGAVAQTAVIPAGAVLTGGGSLAGQVAAGAGLGYIFDVGSDFAAGEEGMSAFKPGAETAVGAVLPVALRGAASGLRGLGNVAADATQGTRTAIGNAASSIGDSISTTGLGQRAREFAQRFPRAARRVGENIEEGAEIAARRENATPRVVTALDEGITPDTIDFVEQFDAPTRKAAQEMFDLAEGGRGAKLPQTVPGRIAGDQLDLIDTQRQSIGSQIGEFSDSLSNQPQDILPAVRNLRIVLDQNGIKPFADGKLVFDNVAITPKQQGILQELYDLSTRSTELSPKQIHQMDQLFSKLQREARFEGVDDVFITVPTADGQTQTNIYKVFRDVFSQKLDEVAEQAGRGDIKELNREYRTLRNLQDNVEDTIVKQSRRDGVNIDPSESAAVSLRRLFGNAQSKAEYQDIYDQLDAVSRSLGYEGARADTLMDFYLTDMKPLYPETVGKTSFEGGIRGAISGIVDRVADLGSPNVTDQQKALRALLEVTEEAGGAAKELTPEATAALQKLGARLNESSPSSVPEYLRNNKQGGFMSGGSIIPERITPNTVASKMDDEDFNSISIIIDDVATARQNPVVNRVLDDMGIGKASDDDVRGFLIRTSDEYAKANPQAASFKKGATPQTTLLEEAKKYKSADEFVKAQGIQEYQGSANRSLNNPVELEGISASKITPSTLERMVKNAKINKSYNDAYQEAIDVLKSPDQKITIFRASPKGTGINSRDYVALSRKGAEKYMTKSTFDRSIRDDYAITSMEVDKKDLIQQGKNSVEFAYFPQKERQQLEDIWKQANK